jgi:arylformamidase
MKLIDLSAPLFNGAQGWPEDPPVKVRKRATHARGGWLVEEMTLTTHAGSHIDAPRHKLLAGASIDQLPLETFIGEAVIADLRGCLPNQPIMSGHLRQGLMEQRLTDRIVLLATRRPIGDQRRRKVAQHPPFLTPEAAKWLAKKGVRAVGIDQCSIGGLCEPFNSRTHQILLEHGVWILEGLAFPKAALRLTQPTTLLALPLALKGMSGAPCRAVLVVG